MNDKEAKILALLTQISAELALTKSTGLQCWLRLSFNKGVMSLTLTVFDAQMMDNRDIYCHSDMDAGHSAQTFYAAVKAIKNNDFNTIIRLSGHHNEEAEQAA